MLALFNHQSDSPRVAGSPAVTGSVQRPSDTWGTRYHSEPRCAIQTLVPRYLVGRSFDILGTASGALRGHPGICEHRKRG